MLVGYLYYMLWYVFIVYYVGLFVLYVFGYVVMVLVVVECVMSVVDFLVVVWFGLNFVCSFCINFVSLNMYYFGDIDLCNVI